MGEGRAECPEAMAELARRVAAEHGEPALVLLEAPPTAERYARAWSPYVVLRSQAEPWEVDHHVYEALPGGGEAAR